MHWCSCTEMLVNKNYYIGFICCGKLNNWPAWHIFIQFRSLIPCSILTFSPFLSSLLCKKDFCLQAICIRSSLFFVTPLFQVKPLVKTCSLLLVTIVNFSSLHFFISPTTKVGGRSSPLG